MDKTTKLKAAYAAPFTEIFECGHPWPLAASNTGFDDGEITGAKGFSLAGFAPWEGDDLWN